MKAKWVQMLCCAMLVACAARPLRAETLGMQRGQMKLVLDNVAREVEKEYYDPTLHGLDWKALVEQTRHKIDAAENVGQMITAIYTLVDKLHDSHTVFLPPQRTSRAYFGFDVRMYGEVARISEVRPKSPAEKAGLKRGDRVIGINGFDVTRDKLDQMMFYFRALRPVGEFQLTLQRDGEPEREVRVAGDIKMGRAVTDLTNMDNIYDMIREDEAEAQQNPFLYWNKDDVGYIALPRVSDDVEFLRSLVKKVEKAKAVIVDLRGNHGGSLEGVAAMAGHFEPKATTLGYVVGRKKKETIEAKPNGVSVSVPMFVLIDSASASAAEIFARHFQREHRATVIGDHSSGSVMAARFFPGQTGADTQVLFGTEITVARFLMADGEELEKKGVTPEKLCLPSGADLREGSDPCLALAKELAQQAIGAAQGASAAGSK